MKEGGLGRRIPEEDSEGGQADSKGGLGKMTRRDDSEGGFRRETRKEDSGLGEVRKGAGGEGGHFWIMLSLHQGCVCV